jgi:hypothetical protein
MFGYGLRLSLLYGGQTCRKSSESYVQLVAEGMVD